MLSFWIMRNTAKERYLQDGPIRQTKAKNSSRLTIRTALNRINSSWAFICVEAWKQIFIALFYCVILCSMATFTNDLRSVACVHESFLHWFIDWLMIHSSLLTAVVSVYLYSNKCSPMWSDWLLTDWQQTTCRRLLTDWSGEVASRATAVTGHSKKKQKGRIPGKTGYSAGDREELLDAVERVKPLENDSCPSAGSKSWKSTIDTLPNITGTTSFPCFLLRCACVLCLLYV